MIPEDTSEIRIPIGKELVDLSTEFVISNPNNDPLRIDCRSAVVRFRDHGRPDMKSNQKTFDFDIATLNHCISRIVPKRKRTVFRGLLFAAANEPRLVDAIDEQGFILMTVSIDKVAAWASVTPRAIRINVDRVRAEEPGILEQSATVNTAAEWMFRIGSVIPESAIAWFIDLVENSKSSPRTFEKFRVNFSKVQGELSTARGELSAEVHPKVQGELLDLSSNSMKHAVHANKTHAQHESLKSSSESQSTKPKSSAVSFRNITAAHVDQIVKRRDVELFDRYFRDLVKKEWARTDDSDRDRQRLAALFHQVARVDEADCPGSVIYAAWKSRDVMGEDSAGKPLGLRLSDDDEDFARELLRVRSDPARSAAAPMLKPSVSESLTPEQLRKQAEIRESYLKQVAVMQRNAAPH